MAEDDVFITNQNFEESLLNNAENNEIVQSKLMKRNKKGRKKSAAQKLKEKMNDSDSAYQELADSGKEKEIVLNVVDDGSVTLKKESDISIDDSLKLDESPPEVHREVHNAVLTTATQDGPSLEEYEDDKEDGSNIVFQETPVNERITLPLSLEKKEFKSSPSLVASNSRVNSPALNSPRIIGARFAIDPSNNPIDLNNNNSSNNNNNNATKDQFTTIPYSPTIKPYSTASNSSESELPFFQPDQLPAASNNRFGGFNRSITENLEHVPLDNSRFATVTHSTQSNPLTTTTTNNNTTVIPMVEVDILPEIGAANGAEEIEVPEVTRPANKIDAFPIVLLVAQPVPLKIENISNDEHYFLKPKNLISIDNQFQEIYYLSPKTRKLFVIRIEYSLENNIDTVYTIKYQELIINIDFDVFRIVLNDNSRYLCLIGNFKWCLVDLNPSMRSSFFQSKPTNIYSDINTEEYTSIKCNTIFLDNSLLKFKDLSINILQIDWHPLSNTHLLVLYSNNQLKLFNTNHIIDNNNDSSSSNSNNVEYEQVFNLAKLYIHTGDSLHKPAGTSTTNSVKIGNVKSFCFGSLINYWSRFSVYLLDSRDYSIYNSTEHFYEPILQRISLDLQSSSRDSPSYRAIGYSIHHFSSLASNYNFEEGTSEQHYNIGTDRNTEENNNLISDRKISNEYNIHLPYSLLIVRKDGTIDITVSTNESLPIWSMTNGYPKYDNDCQYIQLSKYSKLDLELPEKCRVPPTSVEHYTSFSYPGIFVDQLNECVYVYYNCGVNVVQLPWLSTLAVMLNTNVPNDRFGNQSINLLDATIQTRVKTLAQISKEQQKTVQELRTNIEDIRNRQNTLQELVTGKWEEQKFYHDQISELSAQCNRSLPLSYDEQELRSELQMMSNKIEIYKDKLSYFDQQFKSKKQQIETTKLKYSDEPLSTKDQLDIQKKIKLQSNNINDSTQQLIQLTNEIQDLKLRYK
ncbi:hypothetical protein PPL_05592 [Heterostelium album PN500]|uniref:Uncharacterized protein n=1 Tax=Heterostelium pallidum (strain ATCC 26659 / Pp 5 / PN500) TaxID=670386 RepID=D3BAL4_HETP5|nr:hypothetical protein PPL_05592 [Heterostelium album PN500]EFA81601.1 hypothetical protein PPL_05592 [Heterostelium album PN500]|eukprot:XP_020433718.1 hypothetical protein PPL_05592 [Heterostelium album PN500]